jgi:uncharacterized protein HemX
MGTEIIIAFVGVVCTGLSSWFTFFLTKRKYNTEVEAQQIENMKQAFDAYKTTMEDTVKAQNLRIEALQRENESLRNQINQLQAQMLNYMLGKKLGIGEFTNSLPNTTIPHE